MGLVDGVLRASTSRGFRYGLAGSRTWLVVGIAATGWRMIRRASRSEPEVLYRTEIRPDDRIEVRARPRR